ncbi:disulfide bond formation protein B [Rhizobium laguerreae]|uniref:disulfide bond formation protein B n=1 Tax=Rhizobium laguerreae TaxID=1076926 RepID=UPI001C903C9E|nr:disulfide bond formation protein B [Rhizobium laguerreae]MBY3157201.1 disulfide bond formation protein B [Rhizobium laguerreae]
MSLLALPFRCPLLVVAAVVPFTILAVFAIQYIGYPPCHLCLLQRLPWFAMAVLLFGHLAAHRMAWFRAIYRHVLFLFLAILLVSTGLGVFHAGVEFALWEGPKGCSGSLDTTNIDNLLETLKQTKVVSCTKASFWVFGLSLSVWNAIISVGLAVLVGNAAIRPSALK